MHRYFYVLVAMAATLAPAVGCNQAPTAVDDDTAIDSGRRLSVWANDVLVLELTDPAEIAAVLEAVPPVVSHALVRAGSFESVDRSFIYETRRAIDSVLPKSAFQGRIKDVSWGRFKAEFA